MIKSENLTINYDERKIIDDVSFEIHEGSFTTILGPNGCGKSSIIKAIANYNTEYSGNIIFLDTNIKKHNKKTLSKKIGLLFQFNKDIEDYNVFDFVLNARLVYKNMFKSYSKEDIKKTEDIIEITGLTPLRDALMSNLSGGEKQRVYLAMALNKEPSLLVLDEPTNHLDVRYQFGLLNLIKKYNVENNITVLCVLHDLNLAIKYSDDLLLVKDHKIFKSGSVRDCITSENIYEVFGVKSVVHDVKGKIHVDFLPDDE